MRSRRSESPAQIDNQHLGDEEHVARDDVGSGAGKSRDAEVHPKLQSKTTLMEPTKAFEVGFVYGIFSL
jgi:hypothetical protein